MDRYSGVGVDRHDTTLEETLPGLWVCPRCAARLISRNLWHSCGQFTLDVLFAKAAPATLDLARKYVAMLHSLGDVQVIPQKTRLVCVARVRFAGLYPRKDGFLASFALHRWLDSRGSSRPLTMGRGGGGTMFSFDPSPISMASCAPGFRRRTTWWDSRLICGGRRVTYPD
jgi:hypothetical protein